MRQGCGNALVAEGAWGRSFTPQAVTEIVKVWDRVTVRYRCTVKCRIITRETIAVAFGGHVVWGWPWVTGGRIISSLNTCQNASSTAEILSGNSLLGRTVIGGL